MKAATIIKKTVITLILPVLMYLVMMWLCFANDKMYFGTITMWRSLIVDIGLSLACAMGIGLQFKCGRFDFSGGAIMLLAAILAGNLAEEMGNSPVVLLLLCIVICVACSVLVAAVYVFGRVPIVIVTIGMTMFFEAITCLIYGGRGISLISNSSLKVFSSFPMVLVPMILAMVFYIGYFYLTTTGKQAVLLANNQQSAINIGINEKKNVFISYIYSGIIFGFATAIYCSTDKLSGAFSSLETVGNLFTNILPVFIAISLASVCGEAIGIIVGSLSLCLMEFGLEAVYTAEFGSALSVILTGVFLLLFNAIAGQSQLFKKIGKSMSAKYGKGGSSGGAA